jgi:hypothetical protein
MAEQSEPQRVRTEMPGIPGVSAPRSQIFSTWRLRAIGLAVLVVVVALIGIRWLLRARPYDTPATAPVPRVEVPSPSADPNAALPHASETQPVITSVSALVKPWSAKQFFYQNPRTGENVPALLMRLPLGSANQPAGYWALALKAPYGNCNLEYIADRKKLRSEYGFRGATHPMVGNPCSRTLFDPLKIMNLPGNVWARGAIAQGSDLRPPLSIELSIAGKEILAARMEDLRAP